MRLVVTGREGQIVRALLAKANSDLEIVTLGRPELDLSKPRNFGGILEAAFPDVLVNAAAYTAVDKAEEEEALATVINGEAAGVLAKTAAKLGIPMIQISTDYVFDGSKDGAYIETDLVSPINAYGRSKLAGEHATIAANSRHAILRTSWVYDGHGKNFLRTMLRLAETRDELGVVADQIGAPTYAPDIADAVIAVACNLIADGNSKRAGVFHMAGSGETNWAGFAQEIFRLSAEVGGPAARIREITTADYPTPAKRPANSRLNCDKIAKVHGVQMPRWRDALVRCMSELTKKA